MRFLILIFLIQISRAEIQATFSSGENSITQILDQPQLHVTPSSPPAAGLSPGPFSVSFQGKLVIPKRYRLTFYVESKHGTATLKIDGKEVPLDNGVSAQLRINPGEVPFEISFQSDSTGQGGFHIDWSERREFIREPIPASAFTKLVKPTIQPAHLFASHNCAQCHQHDFGSLAMPELHDSGPDLTHIGSRVTEAWLTRWIAQPDKLKPTTTMPAMVDHTTPEGAQAAADLAAYLSSLQTNSSEVNAPLNLDLAQKGGEHFYELGCIACHTLPNAAEPDFKNGRIPLNNIATKFKDGALISFLKNPQKHHASNKMPQFGFSDDEVHALAAYLTKTSTGEHTPDPSEFPPGDFSRGKQLAESLNCASCHQGLTVKKTSAQNLTQISDWSKQGCLAPEEKRGLAPRLNLTEAEKKSLNSALIPQLKYDTSIAFTHRQITSLRCNSCHQNHDQPALISTTFSETKPLTQHLPKKEGNLTHTPPALTHLGAMLHTSYLETLLTETNRPQARPWLKMRMPAFPHHGSKIALGLANLHGLTASAPIESQATPLQLKIGKELISMTGYACVTCHALNEQPALAAFEVQGINFGLAHQRLRSSYFHQWMYNPSRVTPETKMPRYTNPSDGTGLNGEILNGESSAQFEAIRLYLQSISK